MTAQNAKALLKSMSDYLAAQKDISMSYNSIFEVVTARKAEAAACDLGNRRSRPAGQDPHHPQMGILGHRDGL